MGVTLIAKIPKSVINVCIFQVSCCLTRPHSQPRPEYERYGLHRIRHDHLYKLDPCRLFSYISYIPFSNPIPKSAQVWSPVGRTCVAKMPQSPVFRSTNYTSQYLHPTRLAYQRALTQEIFGNPAQIKVPSRLPPSSSPIMTAPPSP